MPRKTVDRPEVIEALRQAAVGGMTLSEATDHLGLRYNTAHSVARKYGIEFQRGQRRRGLPAPVRVRRAPPLPAPRPQKTPYEAHIVAMKRQMKW